MKKVLSLATIMVIALIVLTGCVDVNYEVTLNKDGTADVAYVYGFDKATLEQMGTTAEDMTSEMKQNAEASEYEIEAYSDDKVEGFKAKKHVENPADISLEEAFEGYVTDSEENQFKVEKKGSKTTYSQNANIDLTSMDTTMASMVTMKYTVNLPVKAGKNNADEVSEDGKTLTWNLTAGEENIIEFEATSSSSAVTIAIIVVVALVVIGIAVAVVVVRKSKKGKSKDKSESADVVAEVADSKEKEVKDEVAETNETAEEVVEKEETSEEQKEENETKDDEEI